MSSTNATITRAIDDGEEVTSKFFPPKKSTVSGPWKKILNFFSRQTCSISHGEKIESIPDLVDMSSKKSQLPKIRTVVCKSDRVEIVRDKADWDMEMLINNGKTIVVHFNASWCDSCLNIHPSFVEFSRDFKDMVFLSVDVDDADEVAEEYDIDTLPTFQVWKNGQKMDEYIGTEKYRLRNLIETNS